MKMKLQHLALVFSLLCMALTSCHKSSEIKLVYSIEFSDDLENVADIEVHYTDFNGVMYREKAENGYWEKELVTPCPPVSSKLRVETNRDANIVGDEPLTLEMNVKAEAIRYVDGEVMEAVDYEEHISSVATGREELINALPSFNVERNYVITSDADSRVVLTRHIVVD